MGYIFLLPGEHRTRIHHRIDFFLHFCNDVFIVDIRQDPVDHVESLSGHIAAVEQELGAQLRSAFLRIARQCVHEA